MQSGSPAATIAGRGASAYEFLRATAARLERVHPAAILGPLAATQVAIVVTLALGTAHNGWLFNTGGDSTEYWTATWSLAHGWVPTAVSSYGIPVLLWPLGLLTDSLPVLLPGVVVVQVLLAGPVVVLTLYGIASRIGGRLFGYVAALGWVAAPLVTLAYFYGGYRHDLRTLLFPNALGLTYLADLPSLVALCVAAWLLVRSLDTGAWSDVLLSALVTGFAMGIKPANAVFLPAPLLALAVARRWRHGAGFVLALLPAVGALTLWKWIGFGYVPGFSRVELKNALGPVPALPIAASPLDRLPFSWHTLSNNLLELREVGWSVLLVEWIVVAGSFALIRKAPAKGVLVATWLLAFVFVKGGAVGRSDVYQTTFFRLIEPAFPALVLLAAGCLLLVPTWGRRRERVAPAERRPRLTRGLAAAAVVLAAYPLAMVGLAHASPPDRIIFQQEMNQSAPVSDAFHLTVTRRPGATVLSWKAPPAGGTRLSYRVYASKKLLCHYHALGGRDCLLRMPAVVTQRATTWTDTRPGTYTYVVAALANEQRHHVGGDLVLFSRFAR